METLMIACKTTGSCAPIWLLPELNCPTTSRVGRPVSGQYFCSDANSLNAGLWQECHAQRPGLHRETEIRSKLFTASAPWEPGNGFHEPWCQSGNYHRPYRSRNRFFMATSSASNAAF